MQQKHLILKHRETGYPSERRPAGKRPDVETKTRLFTKSITWQVSGLFMMTVIGYLFTGSVGASGGIALVSAVVGFFCYFLHEIMWSKVDWGRRGSSR